MVFSAEWEKLREKEKLRKKKHLDFVDSLLEAKVMEQIECS